MDLKEVMAINMRRNRHGKQWMQEELAQRTGLGVRHGGAIERTEKSTTVTVLEKTPDCSVSKPAELVTRRRARTPMVRNDA